MSEAPPVLVRFYVTPWWGQWGVFRSSSPRFFRPIDVVADETDAYLLAHRLASETPIASVFGFGRDGRLCYVKDYGSPTPQ